MRLFGEEHLQIGGEGKLEWHAEGLFPFLLRKGDLWFDFLKGFKNISCFWFGGRSGDNLDQLDI